MAQKLLNTAASPVLVIDPQLDEVPLICEPVISTEGGVSTIEVTENDTYTANILYACVFNIN